MTYNAIMDAAYDYRENVLKEKQIKTDTIEPVYDRIDLETAFREGLLWFKDNLWHSAKERPYLRTCILFEYVLPNVNVPCFATSNIIFDNDYEDYVLRNNKIKRWCYINDLI